MYSVYSSDTLIGRSALENGDPPMGVAFGEFVPTEAFANLRGQMNSDSPRLRYLSGLFVRTENNTPLNCSDVVVLEMGEANNPVGWEVTCFGIEYPQYAEFFADHLRRYEAQLK